MNAIVKSESAHEVMESVLIKGDLSRLTPEERNSYYRAVCTSVGLNPLTKPLEYITLNGKLRLYALKDCTDQLRSIHKVSVTDMTEAERDGVYIVKCKVQNAEGRTDMAIGAVNIANLKGEALANAMMKTETKSKRRATLSICGLGMLDETEVDDIPTAQKAPVERPRVPSPNAQRHIEVGSHLSGDPVDDLPQDPLPKTVTNAADGPHKIVGPNLSYEAWTDAYIEAVQSAGDAAIVYKWVDANAQQLEKLVVGDKKNDTNHAARARSETEKHLAFLRKTDPISSGPQKPADDFPGDTPMEATEKPKAARGRTKGSGKACPDRFLDYDGYVSWNLKHIAEAETPEALEALFDAIDMRWDDILSADQEALTGARRDAETRMEQ